MLTKIYLGLLAVSILPMAFLTYYASSWLHSIGDPNAIKDAYFYHSGLGWTVLWATFILLLLIANMILWKTRRVWAVWLSFLYFGAFVILRFWWLEGAYLDFARRNSFVDSSFSLGTLVASLLIVGVGMLVFFDQFVVLRLAEKMHPTRNEVEEDAPEDVPADDSEKDI